MDLQAYPNWVEVNLSAVAENTRWAAARAGTDLMAVVKGDAYGHGAVPVAQTALDNGAAWLGVARMFEARALRTAGISAPILIFGMVTPEEVDEALATGVTLTLHSAEALEMYAARASRQPDARLAVHLKVDTGLGRMGVLPWDAPSLAQSVLNRPQIELQGIYTHFAMVDSDDHHPLNAVQIARFNELLAGLSAAGIRPRYVHMANTVGMMAYPQAIYTLARVGCALVGLRPQENQPFPRMLRRSLTWKTSLASCKRYPQGWSISYGQEYTCQQDEWIGVLPLGYADGYHRAPGNEVLIGGERTPVIGRVCMDMCMLRLSHPFPEGEEVVIIGSQGAHSIQPEDLAERWNFTEVGVTGGIAVRVPRVYTQDTSVQPSARR